MTLFGQEINIEVDEKSLKVLFIALTTLIILASSYFLVYTKIMTLKARKNTAITLNGSLVRENVALKKAKKKYNNLMKINTEQQTNLEKLREKFSNATLKDETDLKTAIQKMMHNLNINLVQMGASEVADRKNGYTKKYIPYVIKGDFYSVGRFFYYLENSKWLLSFRGTGLNIKVANGKLEIKFKVGAYYIERGGEVNFD